MSRTAQNTSPFEAFNAPLRDFSSTSEIEKFPDMSNDGEKTWIGSSPAIHVEHDAEDDETRDLYTFHRNNLRYNIRIASTLVLICILTDITGLSGFVSMFFSAKAFNMFFSKDPIQNKVILSEKPHLVVASILLLYGVLCSVSFVRFALIFLK
ncbi:MAG: hypothetical protein H6727_02540 [Myxococcales bacterium]|nr:hypothetical protein [Myxococcales bacterium]